MSSEVFTMSTATPSFHRLLYTEDEGMTLVRKFGDFLPADKA